MKCPSCGAEHAVADTKRWFVGPDYCCVDCNAFLFLQYKGKRLSADTVLSSDWNPIENGRCLDVDEDSFFFETTTKKDVHQLTVLQYHAKVEESSIRISHYDKKAIILSHRKLRRAFGYILWYPPDKLLNQIYIDKQLQRMGYGTKLLFAWIGRYFGNGIASISIESPNEKTINLIKKNRETLDNIGMQVRFALY
jgi:GNAT superfamily N-acetyltransferase